MLAIGDVGLVVLVLGIVLLLVSIVPSSMKADLRNVGTILAILGAVIYILEFLFG